MRCRCCRRTSAMGNKKYGQMVYLRVLVPEKLKDDVQKKAKKYKMSDSALSRIILEEAVKQI